MALFILFALIGLPLIEIAVFIQVGGEIGLASTLVFTILTAVVGVALMRAQGLSTLARLQQTLDRGEVPVRAGFDAACQLMAGIFLLIPGFVTDFFGFLLFIPPLRTLLLAWIIRHADITIVASGQTHSNGPRRTYDVEGDYRDVTPADQTTPRLGDAGADRQDPHGGA